MKRQKNHKTARLIEALEFIDVRFIEEAGAKIKERPTAGVYYATHNRKKTLRQIIALAACIALLVAAVPLATYLSTHLPDFIAAVFGDQTTETDPELTHPETPPEETTVPAPDTTEDTTDFEYETTEEPWPSTTAPREETTSPEETTAEETTEEETTAPPEIEYDGSRGLEYKVNDDGKTASLIGMGSCKDADIVVASFYKGYPVTDIEFAAFAGSTRITSITLSDSVLRVDYNTFSNCNKNLKHIHISKSVQEFGENAFSFLNSLESITVSPENPRYYVEGNCLIDRETKSILRGWGEFTIPSDGSVTSIAEGAFSCCNIEKVTVPKEITEIGGAAFAFCASLKSISLPEGLTAIGSSMFDSCTSLESITLPDSITRIDGGAFAYCENLLSIRIGRNVEVIEKQAFYYSAVREIEFAGTVSEWKGIRKPDSWDENCFVTVIHCSDGDVEIIEYDGSRGLLYKIMSDGKSAMLIGVGTNPDKSLIIATEYNGVPVTTIAAEAFRNNTNVKSIYILGSVQYIESEAFAFCTSLEKIVLPDSLISIGNGAFNGCTALASINIPAGITEIGAYTFSECSSLKEITIPEGVTNIQNEAFYLCKNLKSVTLPSTLEYIRDWAFANCESLESIVIPDSVKWIGQRAFSDCKKLESLYIGKSVEQIQESAFENCMSLKSVTFPVTLKLLATDAFSGCTNLTDLFYDGNPYQWGLVDKSFSYGVWYEGVPADSISCSGTDLPLNFLPVVPTESNIPEKYRAVLNNEAKFILDSKEIFLDEFCFPYMGTPITKCDDVKYAIVDMDRDGETEVVITGSVGDMLVLHEENGTVYGYDFGFRNMDRIKTDGSFEWNDMTAEGLCYGDKILSFEGGNCKTKNICHVIGDGTDNVQFFVDENPTTQEEYLNRANSISKTEVTWYSLERYPLN